MTLKVKHKNSKGYLVEVDSELLHKSLHNPLYEDFIDTLTITENGYLTVPTDIKWDDILVKFYPRLISMRNDMNKELKVGDQVVVGNCKGSDTVVVPTPDELGMIITERDSEYCVTDLSACKVVV